MKFEVGDLAIRMDNGVSKGVEIRKGVIGIVTGVKIQDDTYGPRGESISISLFNDLDQGWDANCFKNLGKPTGLEKILYGFEE